MYTRNDGLDLPADRRGDLTNEGEDEETVYVLRLFNSVQSKDN